MFGIGEKGELMLTHEQAKKYYDNFGEKQDHQFYENSPIEKLIESGNFDKANNIFELGIGTGRFAKNLLDNYLSDSCTYVGIDISSTMVELSKERLEKYADRVKILQSDGEPHIHEDNESFDRFVSTYVFDLLNDSNITALLDEAYRILKDGGYLCVVSLGQGITITSRIVEKVWSLIFKVKSSLVGGCRPLALQDYIEKTKWKIIYNNTIVSFGVPSEIIVCEKL